MAYFTILLILMGAAAGAVSYNANKALPGEFLYPYKVSVNEELSRLAATTDVARAHLDLFLLNRKLTDAQTLAKHGLLDSRAQTEVTGSISTLTTNLLATIGKFQATGALGDASDLSQRLHDTLDTQVQKVADVSALGSSNLQVSLAPVLTELKTTLATVSLISTKAQAQASVGDTQKDFSVAPHDSPQTYFK